MTTLTNGQWTVIVLKGGWYILVFGLVCLGMSFYLKRGKK